MPTEACPRNDICSNDNNYAPLFFKYVTCPNEAACEEKVIIPDYEGEVLTRSVDKWEHKFV